MTASEFATDHADRTRVVVTGMGAVSPYGPGVDVMWEQLLAGESAIKPIENFDISGFSCTIGGEIRDFDARDFIDRKSARRMARFTQFAVAAAREAIEDAQLDLDALDRSRIGVVLGNGAGGYPEIQATASTLFERGGMRLDPLFLPKVLPNMAAANIAMQFGTIGLQHDSRDRLRRRHPGTRRRRQRDPQRPGRHRHFRRDRGGILPARTRRLRGHARALNQE